MEAFFYYSVATVAGHFNCDIGISNVRECNPVVLWRVLPQKYIVFDNILSYHICALTIVFSARDMKNRCFWAEINVLFGRTYTASLKRRGNSCHIGLGFSVFQGVT